MKRHAAKQKRLVLERDYEDPPPAPDPGPAPADAVPAPAGAPPGPDTPRKPCSDYTYTAWDKFVCQLPKRLSPEARKIVAEKKAVDGQPGEGDGLRVHENALRSWEQAAQECRQKVAAIVKECTRLNQKYRDMTFDLDWSEFCVKSLDGGYPKGIPADPDDTLPSFVKRVADVYDKPSFFVDGADASDVHQGYSGDCWFLASLMAISAKRDLIEERLCVARDEKVDVYGFVFFRDGEWIYEVVDGRVFVKLGDNEGLTLLKNWDREKKEGSYVEYSEDRYDELKAQLQRGGEALYFSHCKSSETWLPLIEKAYAKAHGDYYSIEGGFTSEGIEDLTGGVGVILLADEIMDTERFWTEQLSQVNDKYLFGGSTRSPRKGIVGSHAYAVLNTYDDGNLRLLKIRNPWGEQEWEGDWSDGSKLWTPEMLHKVGHTFGNDGVFWMSYRDFLKRFNNLNRVRLFSEDWHVAQCWTCVNVPWAVDYLDTKFVFTIAERCSVVIVLSQPDDRYFWALRGRYWYALHFQVFKDDDTEGKWIVRSMHSSGAEIDFTRSVSAEIEDLEPGTYNVVFKIVAWRQTEFPTAEEAILKYAKDKKEKLLSVGRRFDYAQSKGNLRAMEKANKTRVVQEARDFNKVMMQRDRKFTKRKKEQAGKRKKRITDAIRERKAAAASKKEPPTDDAQAEEAAPAQAVAGAGDDKGESRPEMKPSTEDAHSKEVNPEVKTDDAPAPPVADAQGEGPAEIFGEDKPAVPAVETADKRPSGEEAAPGSTAPAPEKATEATDSSEPPASAHKSDYRPSADAAEGVSRQFAQLDIGNATGSRAPSVMTPPAQDSDSDEPEDPPGDEDFDWDSEIDDDDDDADPVRRINLSVNNEIFDGDPWNAMCVLGLRVYSHKATAQVSVVKGTNSS